MTFSSTIRCDLIALYALYVAPITTAMQRSTPHDADGPRCKICHIALCDCPRCEGTPLLCIPCDPTNTNTHEGSSSNYYKVTDPAVTVLPDTLIGPRKRFDSGKP